MKSRFGVWSLDKPIWLSMDPCELKKKQLTKNNIILNKY